MSTSSLTSSPVPFSSTLNTTDHQEANSPPSRNQGKGLVNLFNLVERLSPPKGITESSPSTTLTPPRIAHNILFNSSPDGKSKTDSPLKYISNSQKTPSPVARTRVSTLMAQLAGLPRTQAPTSLNFSFNPSSVPPLSRFSLSGVTPEPFEGKSTEASPVKGTGNKLKITPPNSGSNVNSLVAKLASLGPPLPNNVINSSVTSSFLPRPDFSHLEDEYALKALEDNEARHGTKRFSSDITPHLSPEKTIPSSLIFNCPAGPSKIRKSITPSLATISPDAPQIGLNTILINGINYPTRELGRGQFNIAYEILPQSEGHKTIKFDKLNLSVDASEIIFKVAYENNAVGTEGKISKILEDSLKAYDRLKSLSDSTKKFSVPRSYIKPDAHKENKHGNIFILDKIKSSINVNDWSSYIPSSALNTQAFIDQLSGPSKSTLYWAREILTLMAEAAKNNVDLTGSESEFYIDDFGPANAMRNNVSETPHHGTAEFFITDFSIVHSEEPLALSLFLSAKDWCRFQQTIASKDGELKKINIINQAIFNWLIERFPENLKSKIEEMKKNSSNDHFV